MKVSALQEAILLSRKAKVTLFIWGHRGLGKSQITAQTATQNKIGFSDMRLSQCESSDLRGMPSKENGRTVFLPPADLPIGGMSWDEYIDKMDVWAKLQALIPEEELAQVVQLDPTLPDNPDLAIEILSTLGHWREADAMARQRARLMPCLDEGILFLDELNRAQDDVIQAAFQLVLERRLGHYVLPSGWHIVCAGNFMEGGGYTTNGFTDAAFLDRFSHVTLDSGELTLEEWVGYISSKHGNHASNVIEFATQNTKHLDGDIKGEHGFQIQPSRRSWEAVIRVMKITKDVNYSEEAINAVISGLIGPEMTQAFRRYNCPVRPLELIEKGVDSMMNKLRQLTRNQKTGLCWGLVSFLKGNVDDDKKAKVALDFARFLADGGKDKDIAVAFCNLMVGGKNMKDRAALISNPAVAHLFSKFKNNNKKTFLDRLNEDPELQTLISNVAWGKE